ncbi:hypothetical protein QQ045_003719 [Rhodiola kirilowii]
MPTSINSNNISKKLREKDLKNKNRNMSFKLELLFILATFNTLSILSFAMNLTPPINWVVKESSYTRLCNSKKILTVNGLFPGPTLHVHKGDTLVVYVHNQAKYNITIHWHGVKQPGNSWSDGTAYITQCPIKPGAKFRYEVIFSSEEGTLWWHAHSDWSRATVHGPIIVYPKRGTSYPFPKPQAEHSVVLASWFKDDVMDVIRTALENGGDTKSADSFTVNGEPGYLYPCSTKGTFKFLVLPMKSYLFRIVNAIINEEMFFGVAQHSLTVIGMDGAYLKPFKTNYIMIAPGQTIDVLIEADQPPGRYFIAAKPYVGVNYGFNNVSATAIFQYNADREASITPPRPDLPAYLDTYSATQFTKNLRALADKDHPLDVPVSIDVRLTVVVALNLLQCAENSCKGPYGMRISSSLNNISFAEPSTDILSAYYKRIKGVYTTKFPNEPTVKYNYTSEKLADDVLITRLGTDVSVLKYNAAVEIVFQGTNALSAAENHPMHLHGYSFYAVGSGFGNFDAANDPKGYNLIDPPELNTVGVPKNGWAAVRFRANNPGVWLMHCHLERHMSWGMEGVLIVKNGRSRNTRIRKPPRYLNPC